MVKVRSNSFPSQSAGPTVELGRKRKGDKKEKKNSNRTKQSNVAGARHFVK
jgi:hypothetical protein